MDTAQWPQEIVVKPMEEIVVVPNGTTTTASNSKSTSLERRVRPQKEQALNCPRCNSTNTKFCYYNNYSLSQPRYFCKTCRRYWTEGGSLRSIPVGGGSRKNKRSSNNSSNSSASNNNSSSSNTIISSNNNKKLHPDQNPNKILNNHDGCHQDLNLGFPSSTTTDFKTFSELIQVPNFDGKNMINSTSSSNSSHLSALELLTGISTTSSRGNLNSFMPMPPITDPNGVFSSGFSSLGFSLDGLANSNGGYNGSSLQETSGRLLFPFEDLKQVSNAATSTANGSDQNRENGGDSAGGYWNGMLGGGSW